MFTPTAVTLLRRTLFIVVLIGLVFSPAFIRYYTTRPVQSSTASLPASTLMLPKRELSISGLPVRLLIPKISVDAAIDPMAMTPDGAMETPSGAQNVGWFKLGPRPGNTGSAVISGHYGRWIDGQGSVFDNLHTLSKGDSLYVEDEKGTMTTFIVRESRTYGPSEVVPDVFVSSDGKAHLNLITCNGTWDKAQKSYSNRLVVFADKKMEL